MATAAMIPGTVAYELINATIRQRHCLRIGHPAGMMEVSTEVELISGEW